MAPIMVFLLRLPDLRPALLVVLRMTKRLLGYNPDHGIATYHEYDPVRKERTIIHEYDDVDLILENNKLNYNHVNGWNADRTWHKVATIPLSVITKWQLEEGWDALDKRYADKLKQKLNDPEWRFLRTSPGRI